MLNLQKLRYLSVICAYCGKVIPLEERTNDHIIPRCSNGKTETCNIVICCSNCNSLKGSKDINTFLNEHPEKIKHLHNYLNMIDYQMNNKEYSQAIIKNLSTTLKKYYFDKNKEIKLKIKKNKIQQEATLQPESLEQIQNIEYIFQPTGKSFYLNELQSKILDYYLSHPSFSDYNILANELGISNSKMKREIICINNLTGILKIKKTSENGITLNDLVSSNLQAKIIKSQS